MLQSTRLGILLVWCCAACSDDDRDSAECVSTGTGGLEVEINGLPATVTAKVVVAGARDTEVDSTTTLTDLPGGSYTIEAEPVTSEDAIVREVYAPTVATDTVCVGAGTPASATVSYQRIPTSNQLWVATTGENGIVGFSGTDLAESGEPEASSLRAVSAGRGLTPDRDGNIWAIDSGDPMLVRLPAQAGRANAQGWDIGINLRGVGCLPHLRNLAFDPNGALFITACGGVIVKLEPEQLKASADVRPEPVITGEDFVDLAFDASGDLWATADGVIHHYKRSRLTSSTSAAPDSTLTLRDPSDTRDVGASLLAFDAAGDLWALDDIVFSRVPAARLAGTGARTISVAVQVTLGVAALPERFAFDDSGGVWVALSAGKFGRLAPEQLLETSAPGDPAIPATIITSPDIGYAGALGFYPAASGLPLFHALP